MKKMLAVLTCLCLFLNGSATVTWASGDLMSEVIGETYYTRVNLWNSNGISTWCKHKGSVLPLATKVEITSVSKRAICFKAEDGKYFSIKKSRHTNADMSELFNLYFSKENTKSAGSEYYKLSNLDRENVDMANVAPGMSKKAVVMAYGYPPGRNGSASLTAQIWTYWGPNRFESKITLHYRNDIVYKVERLVLGRLGPFGIRTSRVDVDVMRIMDEKEEAKKTSLSEEIEKLSLLHSSGALTDEEFKKAKKKLLDEEEY